jgi:hypothetical protein
MFAVQDGQGGGYGGMGGIPINPPTQFRVIPFQQLLIVRHTTTGQEQVAKLLAAIAAAMHGGDSGRADQ